MCTTEKLQHAVTMADVLQILKMSEYLPFFDRANILNASAFKLLKEADLKCIGIDHSGRQKFLQAIQNFPKNSPAANCEKIQQGPLITSRTAPTHFRIDDKEFYLRKAEDELLRCQKELNLKRIELARINKQTKLIEEIFEMTANAQKQVQKLRKMNYICENPSVKQLVIDVERILSTGTQTSIHSKENAPPPSSLPIARNTYFLQRKIQENDKLPQIPKALNEYTTRPYTVHQYSRRTFNPWYTKIFKPTTKEHCQQQAKKMQNPGSILSVCPRAPTSFLRVQQPVRNGGSNEKYYTAAISSSAPTKPPRAQHVNFVDGFFSKLGKNRTSTPYKQQSMVIKQNSVKENCTRNRSFLHKPCKKPKNIFTNTPTH